MSSLASLLAFVKQLILVLHEIVVLLDRFRELIEYIY